ncbi:hypothetical protein AZH07_RS02345 [Acinetobacter baumannii]|nr:hypothetical protein [Acinetobacter baumannii]
MIIIEDSDIVNWSEYPEYICAVVGITLKDLHDSRTFKLIPKGSNFTWLLDKSPSIINGIVNITDTNINGLGSVYSEVAGACKILEIHFKPRPKPKFQKALQTSQLSGVLNDLQTFN